MSDLIRDAPVGQIVRYLTGNRVLRYPEEKGDFQCPTCYAQPDLSAKAQAANLSTSMSSGSSKPGQDPRDAEKAGAEPAEPTDPVEPAEAAETPERLSEDLEKSLTEAGQTSSGSHTPSGITRQALERLDTSHSEFDKDIEKAETARTRTSQLSRVGTRTALAQSVTRADLEAAFTAASQLHTEPSRPIVPQRTADGTILVDWCK